MSHPRKAEDIYIEKQIGNRLRKRRKLLGLTLEALAGMAELDYRIIQKYEMADVRIPASRLVHLARALGVSVDSLVGPPQPIKDRV